MKIGMVLYPTFGGSGVVATELGKALAHKGNQVHFITYSMPVRLDILAENVHYHEVKVVDYPLFEYAPYELALASKLVSVVKKERLDILHVHYAIPHAYAAFMAKQILAAEGILVSVITTLHGTDITLVGRNPSYNPAVTFSINQSDLVTCVSESLKEETYEYFDVHKDIDVVPNFIDFDQYVDNKPCVRAGIAPNNESIITHVSNFRRLKRTEDVVHVFARILKEKPAKLLFVGDGPARIRTEQLVKDLGLRDDVVFMGKSNDIIRILCLSDLFILPSEHESFGLAALEAMAARTPVISSNAGGIPEVNIHGVSGYVSEIGDVDDMANNALKLLCNPTELERFKQAAFETARKYDIDAILPQYEELYERVMVSRQLS